MPPAFGYAIVYVQSVPDTVAFWERAFGFSESFVHDGKDYGELRCGPTKIAFTSHQLAKNAVPFRYRAAAPDESPLGVEFTLTDPNVDQLHARALDAGAKELAPPHDMPWGQRVSYVVDPNGMAVGIATPM